MRKTIKKGIIFAFVTSVISGIAIFYSKMSLTKIDPLVLTTSRNLFVGTIFLILFILNNKRNELKQLKIKQLTTLIFISIFGGAIPFYLFFTGLKISEAATANLIHKSLFVWVTIMAAFFLKEKINLKYLISFSLVFLATFYFSKPLVRFRQGETLILMATLLWSIENIITKKTIENLSPLIIGLFRMAGGSLILLLTIIFTGKANLLSTITYQQFVVILIGGSILFFYVYFWYKALKYAPASLVTLILTFSTVVGTILNNTFLHIKITTTDIYSFSMIVLALFVIILNGQKRSSFVR